MDPPQDALKKPRGYADSAPRYRTPLLHILVLTGLTLHEDCGRCGGANAIQENGVPRGQKQKRQQDAGATDARRNFTQELLYGGNNRLSREKMDAESGLRRGKGTGDSRGVLLTVWELIYRVPVYGRIWSETRYRGIGDPERA